ncbi:DUF5819 family protein [Streptomyces sp. RFCAC02]|uniref:DUF5819 family protein n=1 Tax=Streptomyces sp. RFCAC02 TaxID=2499143 RepID=UPI0010212D70|nr:DUF5819 family protein [Streptomyces sp. RFCAC02]
MLPSEPGPQKPAEPPGSGLYASPAAAPGTVDAATRTETVGIGALSWPSRIVIALALGGIAIYGVFHLLMVFLFVAPSNTAREQGKDRVVGYVMPEFEQNWKLFAPNPLQRNVAVEVRFEVDGPEGGASRVTEWYDLTATDIDAIRHNLLPSHADQNMLRRAWDLYTGSHDDDGDPVGLRGELSETYIRRIALARIGDRVDVSAVTRVQFREARTRVPAPDWRTEDYETDTEYTLTDWRDVQPGDLPEDRS